MSDKKRHRQSLAMSLWRRQELNECLECHNARTGNGLSGSSLAMTVNCQCSTSTNCQLLQTLDPTLIKLIDVWDSLPKNIKKAVEALCL